MKNLKKLILVFLLLIFPLSLLSACGNQQVKFSIKFMVDDEVYTTIKTGGNETIEMPENPTKDGYTFDGWYWDKNVWEQPFTANSLLDAPLSSDMKVYARFTVIHTHTLTKVNKKDATCTEDGYEEYWTCSCGKKFSDENGQNEISTIPVIAKLNHNPTDWIVDQQPTCTLGGNKHIECSVCHQILESQNILATGHTESDWLIDKNATCTEAGSRHKECTTCKIKIKEENISANGHTESDWIVDSDSTCSQVGSKHKECSICHITISTSTIDKKNHIPTDWIIDQQPTCTLTGSKHKECSVCSEILEETTISANGHTEVIDDAVEATFDHSGLTEGKHCSVCNATLVEQKVVPQKYHIYYELDGGINNSQNPSEYTIESNEIILQEPEKLGYNFLGWFKESSFENKIETIVSGSTGHLTLYAKFNIIEYTITYENVKKAINNNPDSYTIESATIILNNPTKTNYSFVNWTKNGETITQIESGSYGNITITANWVVYGLNEISYNKSKTAVSVNDTLNASLFDAICYDTDGNPANIDVTYTGIFAGGNEITIKLIATLNGVTRQTSFSNVKVYDLPTLSFDDTKDYFNLKNGLTRTWFNASGEDSFGNNTIINVLIENEYVAGDIVTVKFESVDPAGNKTTGELKNVKVYGLPTINYDTTLNEIKFDDELTVEYFSATAKNSFGEDLLVTINYSNIIDGQKVTVYLIATDSKNNTRTVELKVNVYGLPTIYSATKTDFKVSDTINIETLGIIAKDSFGKLLDVTISLSSGNQTAGSTMIYIAQATDHLGNVQTKQIKVKIYDTPTITALRTDIRDNETISLSTFNVVTKDSFNNNISVSYEYLSGTQTSGSEMTYKFYCTDNAGNYLEIQKQIKVYGQNDIDLIYGEYSDLIKKSSKGEEFSARATDAFGNQCSISIRVANNYTLAGGEIISLYIVATDKAGNEKVSNIINNIKVYDIPCAVLQKQYGGNEDLSSLYKVFDSFNNELSATITIVSQDDNYIVINIKATDIAGNVLDQNVYDISKFKVTTTGNERILTKYVGSETNVVIPYGITSIGEYAFNECTGITSITIPNSVTSIGDRAFIRCSGLIEIKIPDSVISIGIHAFWECTGLTSIIIPKSITNMEVNTFMRCYRLVEVYNLSDLPIKCGSFDYGGVGDYAKVIHKSLSEPTNLVRSNGVIYYIEGLKKIAVGLVNYEASSIILDNDCTSINNAAFKNCLKLTNMIVPTSVTSIGESAFSGCTGLISITLPFVGNGSDKANFGYIFGENGVPTSLKEVVVTGGTSIGNNAFYKCTGITSIALPNSVALIGSGAFEGCTGLTSITIPNGITSIGNNAFMYCYRLVEVYNLSNLPIKCGSSEYGGVGYYAKIIQTSADEPTKLIESNGVIYYVDELEKIAVGLVSYRVSSINIEDNCTGINNYAFYNTVLTSITIPNSVTNIGDYAFRGCTGLTIISISENVTKIGSYAFKDCIRLTSITIPNSVTIIGSGAFEGCTGLTSISISENVTKIGSYAFKDCTRLTSIAIPNSVTIIDSGTFEGCTGLTSITIPNGITSIGVYAFSGCTWLTSIIIPNSVINIDIITFSGCSSLTKVYYVGNQDDWKKISIGSGNSCFTNATVYYYSETEPTDSGNYWHYVDDEVTEW